MLQTTFVLATMAVRLILQALSSANVFHMWDNISMLNYPPLTVKCTFSAHSFNRLSNNGNKLMMFMPLVELAR